MEFLKSILRVLNLGDSSTGASKAWNILVSLGAITGFLVVILCKVGIPVPGVPCAQVGEVIENATDAGELPETAPVEEAP